MTFCQKVLTKLRSRILTIKIGVICLYKNVFFFSRLNRVLYFWVFKCQISACRFLYEGCYCNNKDNEYCQKCNNDGDSEDDN